MLVSTVAGAIVDVPAMLLFNRKVTVETDIVAGSPCMTMFVELVMPIPAAMIPPSPPATEVLFEAGSMLSVLM